MQEAPLAAESGEVASRCVPMRVRACSGQFLCVTNVSRCAKRCWITMLPSRLPGMIRSSTLLLPSTSCLPTTVT